MSRSVLSWVTGRSDDELARGLDRLGLLAPLERIVAWLNDRLPTAPK